MTEDITMFSGIEEITVIAQSEGEAVYDNIKFTQVSGRLNFLCVNGANKPAKVFSVPTGMNEIVDSTLQVTEAAMAEKYCWKCDDGQRVTEAWELIQLQSMAGLTIQAEEDYPMPEEDFGKAGTILSKVMGKGRGKLYFTGTKLLKGDANVTEEKVGMYYPGHGKYHLGEHHIAFTEALATKEALFKSSRNVAIEYGAEPFALDPLEYIEEDGNLEISVRVDGSEVTMEMTDFGYRVRAGDCVSSELGSEITRVETEETVRIELGETEGTASGWVKAGLVQFMENEGSFDTFTIDSGVIIGHPDGRVKVVHEGPVTVDYAVGADVVDHGYEVRYAVEETGTEIVVSGYGVEFEEEGVCRTGPTVFEVSADARVTTRTREMPAWSSGVEFVVGKGVTLTVGAEIGNANAPRRPFEVRGEGGGRVEIEGEEAVVGILVNTTLEVTGGVGEVPRQGCFGSEGECGEGLKVLSEGEMREYVENRGYGRKIVVFKDFPLDQGSFFGESEYFIEKGKAGVEKRLRVDGTRLRVKEIEQGLMESLYRPIEAPFEAEEVRVGAIATEGLEKAVVRVSRGITVESSGSYDFSKVFEVAEGGKVRAVTTTTTEGRESRVELGRDNRVSFTGGVQNLPVGTVVGSVGVVNITQGEGCPELRLQVEAKGVRFEKEVVVKGLELHVTAIEGPLAAMTEILSIVDCAMVIDHRWAKEVTAKVTAPLSIVGAEEAEITSECVIIAGAYWRGKGSICACGSFTLRHSGSLPSIFEGGPDFRITASGTVFTLDDLSFASVTAGKVRIVPDNDRITDVTVTTPTADLLDTSQFPQSAITVIVGGQSSAPTSAEEPVVSPTTEEAPLTTTTATEEGKGPGGLEAWVWGCIGGAAGLVLVAVIIVIVIIAVRKRRQAAVMSTLSTVMLPINF